MSIDQLKTDLEAITASIGSATGIPDHGSWASWVRNELLPYLESQVNEMAAMDESIGDIFHQSEDVLHTDSAAVFAAVIASGMVLGAELKTRIGGDRRLLRAIEEFEKVARHAQELLGEITIVDADEEEDEEEDEEAAPAPDVPAPAAPPSEASS